MNQSDRMWAPVDIVAEETYFGKTSPLVGAIPRVAQIPPYWLYKPVSGIDYYFNQSGILAAVAGATLDLGSAVILDSYEAANQVVNIFIDAPTALTDIRWALLINERAVPGWDQLREFPRGANNLNKVWPGIVQFTGPARVTIRATNVTAAGPWNIGAEVTGWSWPTQERLATFGAG